eukprot:296728_1
MGKCCSTIPDENIYTPINPHNTVKSQEDTSDSDHVIISTDEKKMHFESRSNPSRTVVQQYKSPLAIIIKRPLIVAGYIRKQKQFYPNEIIKIIYNFYLIEILNYKIKEIGKNEYGQQGIGNRKNVKRLTTIKTYKKQIKNIVNGHKNIYILFT